MTATTNHTHLETHVTVSGPSDIISGVGLDVATSRLVGRDREAGSLAQLLGIGTADERGMVLLSGDAGIGKTRLLGEVAGRARDEGWTVLVGHCLGEAGQSMPYLPFSEMLTRLEAADPSSVERTMSAHSALAALFPARRRRTSTPGGEAPDTVDQRDLVEAAHAAFEGISWDAPLLLVVEDVHWADQSSRDLLTLFFTRGFGGRVSIVASYRSDDLHRRHPLRTTLAHWSRLGDLHRVDLEPLPDAAVRELVRAVQPRPLTEPEVRAVVDRAGMPAMTPRSITDVDALVDELATVRAAGHAVDDGEQENGVRCVAVALPHQPATAMSVSGPAGRFPRAAIAELVPTLHAAAERLAGRG